MRVGNMPPASFQAFDDFLPDHWYVVHRLQGHDAGPWPL